VGADALYAGLRETTPPESVMRRVGRAAKRAVASAPPVRLARARYRDWKAGREHREVMDLVLAERDEGIFCEDGVVRATPAWLVASQPAPRLDLYVRVLALEELTGLSSDGIALYERFMANPRSAHRSWDSFRRVFESVAAQGLLDTQPFTLHRSKILGDGWHRLACAIVLDIPHVAVRGVRRDKRLHVYTVDTLRERGFSEHEVAAVLDAERRTLARIGGGARHSQSSSR
jgi:hypothetical protein